MLNLEGLWEKHENFMLLSATDVSYCTYASLYLSKATIMSKGIRSEEVNGGKYTYVRMVNYII